MIKCSRSLHRCFDLTVGVQKISLEPVLLWSWIMARNVHGGGSSDCWKSGGRGRLAIQRTCFVGDATSWRSDLTSLGTRRARIQDYFSMRGLQASFMTVRSTPRLFEAV
jgi:hypothetical protein